MLDELIQNYTLLHQASICWTRIAASFHSIFVATIYIWRYPAIYHITILIPIVNTHNVELITSFRYYILYFLIVPCLSCILPSASVNCCLSSQTSMYKNKNIILYIILLSSGLV